ncbi:hypothetical protein I6I99_11005 [Sphingobacterium multivorum]|nr:hypothetical protein [Sphingobacterium multivorum]QQT33055.1 hypothetical protein I6I99_11005 [Sphingobacterium multivorum]
MRRFLLFFFAVFISVSTYAQGFRYGYCKTNVIGSGDKKGIYISDLFKFPVGESMEGDYTAKVAQKWRDRLKQVLGDDYPRYGPEVEVIITNSDCGGSRYFSSYTDAEDGRDCLVKRIKNSSYSSGSKYFKILFRFDY